jgi:hypothetical protein
VIGARIGLGAVWISAMSVAEAGSVCGPDAVHVLQSEYDASSSTSVRIVENLADVKPPKCVVWLVSTLDER